MTRTPIRSALTPVLAGLALVLAAGCTNLTNDANGVMPDGAHNHPILVEPSYKSLRLSTGQGLLNPGEAAQLDAFIADYRDHGSGSIAVSAPAGPAARNVMGFFADHINRMGISRDKILLATHDAPDGDPRVEVNYVSYQARTEKCGDWSENLAFTLDNSTPKNFGCSVQQNIAAMVADPRDLISPRNLGESSGARRVGVLGKYEAGEITSSNKRKGDLGNEQSGLSNAVQ